MRISDRTTPTQSETFRIAANSHVVASSPVSAPSGASGRASECVSERTDGRTGDRASARRAADGYARTADEAANALEGSPATGGVAAAARLVTRIFGFRFGKFGLTYKSQDVAVDAEAIARDLAERQAKAKSRAFGEELDAAQALALTDRPSDLDADPTATRHSADFSPSDLAAVSATAQSAEASQPRNWLVRLAFSLYRRNADPASAEAPEQQPRSRLLAVA